MLLGGMATCNKAITDDMVSLTKALFHPTIFTRPQTTLQLAWAALG